MAVEFDKTDWEALARAGGAPDARGNPEWHALRARLRVANEAWQAFAAERPAAQETLSGSFHSAAARRLAVFARNQNLVNRDSSTVSNPGGDMHAVAAGKIRTGA